MSTKLPNLGQIVRQTLQAGASLPYSVIFSDLLYSSGELLTKLDNVVPVVGHGVGQVHEVVQVHWVLPSLANRELKLLLLFQPQPELDILGGDLDELVGGGEAVVDKGGVVHTVRRVLQGGAGGVG